MPSTGVIILNWKRPQNIGRIVTAASEALPDATILIVDQAEPAEKLAGRSDIPFDRCWIRSQENVGPTVRFKLAAALPFDHYLCIDDDVLLSADQIRQLMRKLEEAPDAAHGVGGLLLVIHADLNVRIAFTAREGPISVLNEVYAFTRERAQATLRLAARLGYERWEDIGFAEDMLISGAGPSVVADIGPIRKCTTRSDKGIAIHHRPQFMADRRRALLGLIGRRLLYTESSGDLLDTTGIRGIGLPTLAE